MARPSPTDLPRTAHPDTGRLMAQAVALSRAGQLVQAEQLCRQVLAVQPAEPTALHVLGVCLLQRGEYAAAEQALAACLQAQPNEPAALGNRGIALQALGRFDEALACYAQALALAPQQPATLNMQGLALMELKRFDEALQSFEQAVAIAPDFAEAWCSRANALIHLRQYDPALASLDRAETLRPNYGEALSNRSIVLNLLGRHNEALAAAQRAAQLLPQHPTIERNLADALAGLQRFDQALAHYQRAIEFAPADRALLVARADLLAALGRQQEAASDYHTALALIDEGLRQLERALGERPDPSLRRQLAEAHYERGLLLVDMCRHRDAVESFVQATRLEPGFVDAHWAEALNRLRLGDFEAGWRAYEWRRQRPGRQTGLHTFDAPDWLGEVDPAGLHILLHAEQGYGDVLQFCRYAPLLAARGARVTVLAQSALKPLLSGLPGVDVIAEGEPLPPFDRQCPLMSLPFAFRTSLATVPAAVPYLRVAPVRVAHWRSLLGAPTKPRIGLVWSGNARHEKDRERSMPLAAVAPLFGFAAEYFGLNKETREADRTAARQLPLHQMGTRLADFSDTAAVIENLDLVITVDTAVAHLAGALGRPVWILLDARADFRWMLDRDDTPWYPTARLFRQTAPGGWQGVVERVARELDRFLATAARPGSPATSDCRKAAVVDSPLAPG